MSEATPTFLFAFCQTRHMAVHEKTKLIERFPEIEFTVEPCLESYTWTVVGDRWQAWPKRDGECLKCHHPTWHYSTCAYSQPLSARSEFP